MTADEARKELDGLFRDGRILPRLQAYVRKVFPNLKEQVDDIVQQCLAEVYAVLCGGVGPYEDDGRRLRTLLDELALYRNQGLGWQESWWRYLRRRLRWRSIDLLRRREEKYFADLLGNASEDSMAARLEPTARGGDPAMSIAEVERRQRQVHLLSDILREFVTWCENRGQTLKKEVYERRLRDQKPEAIATALGLQRNYVDQLIKRARDWIGSRIEKRDVHRSVFLTLHGRVQARPSVPESAPFTSFREVLHFVINDMGTLCPSEARLSQYRNNPSQQDCRDVHYHVREVGCRLCNAELER